MMMDNIDQVQELIERCISKLREAQEMGRKVDKGTIREAQKLLSIAAGTLTLQKELEDALSVHYSDNVIKFPGR